MDPIKEIIYCDLDHAAHLATLGKLREAEVVATNARQRAEELVNDRATEDQSSADEAGYLRLRSGLVLSRVYLLQGRTDEGRELCESALNACRRLRANQYRDARPFFDLELDLAETRGELAEAAEDPEKAIRAYREVLARLQKDLKAKMPPSRLLLRSLLGEIDLDLHHEPKLFYRYVYTQLRLARALADCGRPYEAEQQLGRALRTTLVLRTESPDYTPLKYRVVDANVWASAAALFADNRRDESAAAAQYAAAVWREALEAYPEAAEYRSGLRGVKSDLGWFVDQFPEHDPTNPLAPALRETATAAHDTPFFYHTGGLGWAEMQRWQTAITWFHRAAERRQSELQKCYDWLQLALAYHHQGNSDYAELSIARADEQIRRSSESESELSALYGTANALLSPAHPKD